MAETDSKELHCPLCGSGLGITDVPEDGGAIECPACHRQFQPAVETHEADGEIAEPAPRSSEDLDAYLDQKIRGNLPEPRDPRQLPSKSGDATAGWSKWEHASPNPRAPGFRQEIRKADEVEKSPEPMIQDLAGEKKDTPKFSEFGRAHVPEERQIDAEQRRRREVLQKGWETLSDPTQQARAPTISKKDSLKFERNLISTSERKAEPGELKMKRRRHSAKKDRQTLKDGGSDDPTLGGFTIERMEKVQRIKSLILGVLGASVVLAAAVGVYVILSEMWGEESAEPPSAADQATAPINRGFSVSSNYNTIISRLREFLEAEDVDSMLNTVRNRQVVEPLARKYYKTHRYSRRLLRDIPSQDAVAVVDGFAIVTCVVGRDEVLWVPMEIAAGLKIDWESTVSYSDMEWAEFARKRPASPTLFRARIEPVSHYDYGFTQDKYVSIQLSDPKLNHVFYGYIPRQGPLIDKFMQLLPEALSIGMARDLRAVVELQYPEHKATANQVEIVSLKARGWVYSRDLKAATRALELFANDARIVGDGARLNDALRIADWEDSGTTLEWRVNIERPVHVSVFAVMANGGEAGKGVSLSVGPQRIIHSVPVTGGWDTFQEVLIGDLDFPSRGNYTLRLKHTAGTGGEPLMILDRLIFRSGNELAGSRVRDPRLKPLVHTLAILPDEKLPGNTLTDPERAAGWRMLFNGKDLKGWTGYRRKAAPAGWSVQANQLMLVEPGCGALMTTEEFDDFELKLEWQTSDGQASGVFLRVAETKPTVEQTAIEIELNGHSHSTLSTQETEPLTANGAVKHLYPPQAFSPRESGWNELRVRFIKNQFQYWINGEEMGTVDRFGVTRAIDIQSEEWNQRVDESRVRRFQRFANYSKGYIALEDAGTPARFRNIKVLVLGKEEYKE